MRIRAAVMTSVLVAGALRAGRPRPLARGHPALGAERRRPTNFRARAKWPVQDREIEEAIALQDAARAAGDERSRSPSTRTRHPFVNRRFPSPIGQVLGQPGRIEEARSKFEAALKADPFLPWAHHGLATCFATMDRLDDAAKAYRRALDLNPELPALLRTALPGVLMRLGPGGRGRTSPAETGCGAAERSLGMDHARQTRGVTGTRYTEAAAAFEEVDKGFDRERRGRSAYLAFTLRKGDRLDRALEIYGRLARTQSRRTTRCTSRSAK
jgi:tetratricopeptide (TPR) repeat protein